MGGLHRDHAAIVHFRAGRGQGQHGAEGQGAVDAGAARLQDVPRFARVIGGGGDELGAVDHRTAAHGEQEVELFAPHLLHRAHQGFIAGVRFDAAELLHRAGAERGPHFGQGAGLFGAGAAEKDQHARRFGHQLGQFGDGVGAEDDFAWVVEFKVQHACS